MFGFNLFAWIRAEVRKAVLGGVQDAVTQLDAGGHEDAEAQVEALESRFTVPKSLPSEESNGRSKARAAK